MGEPEPAVALFSVSLSLWSALTGRRWRCSRGRGKRPRDEAEVLPEGGLPTCHHYFGAKATHHERVRRVRDLIEHDHSWIAFSDRVSV